MKCPKCKANQKEGALFCHICGLDFMKFIEELKQESSPTEEIVDVEMEQAHEKQLHNHHKILIFVLLCFLIGMFLILFFLLGFKALL